MTSVLSKADRATLFAVEAALRDAKGLLGQLSALVRGGFGGPPDVLKGTELYKLIERLDSLQEKVSAIAMAVEHGQTGSAQRSNRHGL